jgi:hypothetical protein
MRIQHVSNVTIILGMFFTLVIPVQPPRLRVQKIYNIYFN